ncbi:HAMP domain-containing histidine kinase [Paenibacillus sp. LS1]|uniref:sensor histidine kinase n=1 Tax=Paenibacillus sp. LS1 TaxID=2992120 RepID=UPI00223143C5|nr:HAMP domain-containing sensor histidine kinase [Paenibacillus sp. LS1]MCW3795629.1 HAMP domain-containing histidine kinase [Paenibacillus sp. LS1]
MTDSPWFYRKHRIRFHILISSGLSFLMALLMTFICMLPLAAVHHVAKLHLLQLHLAYLVLILFTTFFVISFFILTHRIVREIATLDHAISIISEGDLSYRVPRLQLVELRKFSSQLQSMVEQLQEQMIEEYESETAKREWIEGISNELYAPLEGIIRNVELLKTNSFRNQEEYNRIIQETYTDAFQFRKLMNDLIQHARLSSHDTQLNLEKADVVQLMQRTISDFESTAKDHDFMVEKELPSSPIMAHIDVVKIEMALHNLLFHVLKHSTKPGTIRLIFKADHRQLVIGIEGNFSSHPDAYGIPMDRTQQHSSSRTASEIYARTAMGLHIARNMIKLQGGTLTLNHANNIIVVTVPLDQRS